VRDFKVRSRNEHKIGIWLVSNLNMSKFIKNNSLLFYLSIVDIITTNNKI